MARYRLPKIVEAEQVEKLKKSNNISEITKINLITKCNRQKINNIKLSIKCDFRFARKYVHKCN